MHKKKLMLSLIHIFDAIYRRYAISRLIATLALLGVTALLTLRPVLTVGTVTIDGFVFFAIALCALCWARARNSLMEIRMLAILVFAVAAFFLSLLLSLIHI